MKTGRGSWGVGGSYRVAVSLSRNLLFEDPVAKVSLEAELRPPLGRRPEGYQAPRGAQSLLRRKVGVQGRGGVGAGGPVLLGTG